MTVPFAVLIGLMRSLCPCVLIVRSLCMYQLFLRHKLVLVSICTTHHHRDTLHAVVLMSILSRCSDRYKIYL